MSPGLLRRALGATALLVLVVIVASAFIRLSQAGLDCRPWPACHAAPGSPGAEHARPAAPDGTAVTIARGIHRIAATAVGILLLGIVLVGWDRFRGAAPKGVALAALVLTAFLAWLGRYTPSDLPVVVLGNMLGGMVLFGLLWSLAGGGPALPRERGGRALSAVLALLALQLGLGAVLSARRNLLDCPTLPACNGAWWPAGVDSALFNLVAPAAAGSGNGAALVLLHRYGAVIAVLLVGLIVLRIVRRSGQSARKGQLVLVLLAGQVLLGAALVLVAPPLPMAVLHNFAAALLVAALVQLSWPKGIHAS